MVYIRTLFHRLWWQYVFDSWLFDKNTITGWSNIILRKFNVKLYGFDETHMNKDLKEDKLYPSKAPTKSYSILLDKIHPSYDRNGRLYKILLDNYDNKINLYCMKYSMFTKNRNTKINHKIDSKIYL